MSTQDPTTSARRPSARPRPRRAPAGRGEGGFVLMVVLFVLLALFVFTAPFLATARNADRASRHLADQAQARLALDAAARRARVDLEASHPALDPTPYFDDLDELRASAGRATEGFDPHDPQGVMWSAEVHDVAGRIDLDSCPPQVIANLLGVVARLGAPLPADGDAIEVNRPDALPRDGVVWVGGEMIRVEGRDGDGNLAVKDRGLETVQDEEKNWITYGPRPPSGHGVGAQVMDQRAFAPVLWRTAVEDGVPRDLDTVDQLLEADAFALAGALGDFPLDVLRRHATTDDGLRAGPEWQRPTRLVSLVEAGKTFAVQVEDSRWFGVGSTVRITDGLTTELRFVTRRSDAGQVFLDRVLDHDYRPWRAEVSVMVRRPVNVNTASVDTLEAVFLNVGLTGQNSRIDEVEARELAALTVASRPFTGLEDWLRRVVLPGAGVEPLPDDAPVKPASIAAGGTVLSDPRDAAALYLNSLNANDARLAFSTMPLCFTSRDTYALELRAAVNGEAGILLQSAVRERVELVTPQVGQLLHVFARQEDFDESLRLGRRAPWWATGPAATTRFDAGVEPPSRAMAHFGTLDGAVYIPGITDPAYDDEGLLRRGEHVFATRDDEGAWCQLAPARVLEQGRLVGRMEHFDHETRDLEGRYLPDQTLSYDPSAPKQPVQFVDPTSTLGGGLLLPISFEGWFKPRQAGDGTFLSVGGPRADSDRIVLGLEGDDLVLRVLDGFGDHRLTAQREAAEARFRVARSETDPGFPVETWSHVKVDVQGSRPDQLGLYVNGLAAGVRRPGLTRLTAPLPQGAATIAVESTEGFPSPCVVRIGDELVECTVTGQTTMAVQHLATGEFAGSGGRLARQRWSEVDRVPEDLATVSVGHPIGAAVALYGYSSVLATDVPAGRSALPASLGPWRVARVLGTPQPNDMDPVQVSILAQSAQLGLGWLPTTTGDLQLALGDDPQGDPSGSRVMSAFDPRGGYAALVGVRIGGVAGGAATTPNDYVIGGVEIVRYSGWSGNALRVVQRDAVASLPTYAAEEVQDQDGIFRGARAFVFQWDPGWIVAGGAQGGTEIQGLMNWQCYLLPISLSVPGATQLTFLQSTQGASQFAQITELQDPERTEWVRYDDVDIDFGQLVRSSPVALQSAYSAIFSGASFTVDPAVGGPGGPGGGGGGGGGGIFDPGPGAAALRTGAVAGPTSAAAPAQQGGVNWDPFRGVDPNEDLPLTRAVAAGLHFRGVLGTATGDHAPNTPVVPVFQVLETSTVPGERADGGVPGAFDPVFLVGAGPAHLGWPMRVHRAHLPSSVRPRYGWQQSSAGVFTAVAVPPPAYGEEEGDRITVTGYPTRGRVLVAFDDAAPEAILAGVQVPPGSPTPPADPRIVPRLVKFPSGELPRLVTSVAVGSGAGGIVDFGVPSASCDELAFGEGRTVLGGASSPGASLVVAAEVLESAQGMTVDSRGARGPGLRRLTPAPVLQQLPANGGLLRIGEEVVAYNGLDPSNGGVSFAVNGRGLLGTRAQPHQVSEPVAFLEHWTVTVLAADVSADDATLPVTDLAGFPPMGLVLIDGELVHYTRLVQGALDMPRRSGEPGAMDERGGGAFRGRFGTTPSGHVAGTAVILFPFRYWDRYAPRFDGPELAYFGLSLDQPDAWWEGVTYEEEGGPWGGADLVVLQRTRAGAPWDADETETPGLVLLEDGTRDGDFVPVAAQSDRIEWRAFARYRAGAFDPLTGLDHGWKETPRLRHLAVTYFGPGRVLRSVDR